MNSGWFAPFDISNLMKLFLVLLSCLIFALIPLSAATIRASTFGFDPQDATECLQKAFASGAEKVIIDNVGQEWLCRPLILPSDTEIYLEDGVILRAKPGDFHGKNDCLLKTVDGKNILLHGGANATIMMNKKDYQNHDEYDFSEWRHSLFLCGSENITVRNLRFRSSGGDGIALGRGRKNITNHNIRIENCIFEDHHRLGMGVVSVDGLLIQGCKFLNNSGTPPQCGIDFEPNFWDEPIANIRIADCLMSGNAALGLMFILGNCNEKSPAVSAIVENCDIQNNTMGGIRLNSSTGVQGKIQFRNCRIHSFRHHGISLYNFGEDGIRLSFENCVLDHRQSRVAPLLFSSVSAMKSPFGNIDFGNLKILMETEQPLATVESLDAYGISATTLKGKPCVCIGEETRVCDLTEYAVKYPGNPAIANFKTRPFLAKEFTLPPETNQGVRTAPLCLRGTNRFLQWIPENTAVDVHFKAISASGYKLEVLVEVQDTTGGLADSFTVTGQEEFIYTFKPGGARLRVFKMSAGANAITVWSDFPGQGFPADTPLHFFCTPANLFFWVKADQTQVALEIRGEEPLCATVLDPRGKIMADFPTRFSGVKYVLIERTPTENDELWQLRTHNVVEDYSLRLGMPSPPCFFTTPENRLLAR